MEKSKILNSVTSNPHAGANLGKQKEWQPLSSITMPGPTYVPAAASPALGWDGHPEDAPPGTCVVFTGCSLFSRIALELNNHRLFQTRLWFLRQSTFSKT